MKYQQGSVTVIPIIKLGDEQSEEYPARYEILIGTAPISHHKIAMTFGLVNIMVNLLAPAETGGLLGDHSLSSHAVAVHNTYAFMHLPKTLYAYLTLPEVGNNTIKGMQ